MKRTLGLLTYLAGLVAAIGLLVLVSLERQTTSHKQVTKTVSLPVVTPTITPTPTPKPLTLAEMNQLYGPCIRLPVLMYHHIQDLAQAKKEGHGWLSVSPEVFSTQMQYLKQKGYQTVSSQELINFFDNGTKLPNKPVMLTFDDGYEDFFVNARPALNQNNFGAMMFLPTGLMNNPGYLAWNEIGQMTGKIEFANHTWSHYYLKGDKSQIEKEIDTAQTQLEDHGLGKPKVFAYPYGYESQNDIQILTQKDFKLAFTTRSGSIQCAKKRLVLPRIRVGNVSLANYGL